LIDSLQKEVAGIDNDVKAKFSQYSTTKTNLAQAERKRTGNLSTKSLTTVVNPRLIIRDSDYLDTHLIAVPNMSVKDFYKNYETLSDKVVPRSAIEVAKDEEFTLFAVVTFKKTSADFIHKCREKRWTPREYTYKEGGKEAEAKEASDLEQEAKKLWGEALRLGRTGYSESAMIWVHVLALRVFVETVLRYGLPLDFVCGLIQVCLHCSTPDPMVLTYCRPIQKLRKRRGQISTQTTLTLEATLSTATTKVVRRRMTRLSLTRCSHKVIWAMPNTHPTCTMNLKSYRVCSASCVRI
jgi:hypothetical protein